MDESMGIGTGTGKFSQDSLDLVYNICADTKYLIWWQISDGNPESLR